MWSPWPSREPAQPGALCTDRVGRLDTPAKFSDPDERDGSEGGPVDNAELMQGLLDVADAAGLEVRTAGAGGRADGEPPLSSAVCKVKGSVWVVISAQDPVEVQIDVLARALRSHAADYLDSHFLSPAIRARLGGSAGDSG